MLVPLLIAGVVLASEASASDPSTCATLDAEARSVLQTFVERYYPEGSEGECASTSMYAAQAIIDRGESMLPCLLDVHRNGLGKTGLWLHSTPAPATTPWALELIKTIAPETAKDLYRGQLRSLDNPLEEAAVWLELARLGDPEGLRQITSFLRLQSKADQTRARPLVNNMLDAVAVQHYRPALPGLEKLRAEGYVNPLLPVFIAQLKGDVESLKELAAEPGLAGRVLRTLVVMDRLDVLQSLADDPYYRYRKSARETLTRESATAKTE